MAQITYTDTDTPWQIVDGDGNIVQSSASVNGVYSPTSTLTTTASGYSNISYPSSGTWTTGNLTTYGPVTVQQPYTCDGEWDSKDTQEAASHGWMLTHNNTPSNGTPQLEAWKQGSKADKTDKEIFEDVLEQSLTGQCPIAFKILSVLTKNRSPYSEFAKAVEAMAVNYEVGK